MRQEVGWQLNDIQGIVDKVVDAMPVMRQEVGWQLNDKDSSTK
jgi:hypothetical protein